MASPRETTTLLRWVPKAGTAGGRDAGKALMRAFADAAADHRQGKVREVLKAIAAQAEAQFEATRTKRAERHAEATAEPEPEPEQPAPAPTKRAKAVAKAKAEGDAWRKAKAAK